MKLCDYGCGREAKHYFPTANKWCCEKDCKSCSKSKEEQSKRMKKVHNRPDVKNNHKKAAKEKWKNLDYRQDILKRIKEGINQQGVKEKQSISHKYTIDQIQERYKTFTREEEMRYNPDKPEEKEIQVHCKYDKCDNSKEKGGWFTPVKSQIYERIRQLEKNDGNDGCYFYCPEGCKQKCCLYNLISDPNIRKEFEKYHKKVGRETNITIKNFSNEIKNIEFRGKKFGYALDHKYSVHDGFENNVDPKIISHYKNLECITESENSKKNRNSSIILEELKKQIKECSG